MFFVFVCLVLPEPSSIFRCVLVGRVRPSQGRIVPGPGGCVNARDPESQPRSGETPHEAIISRTPASAAAAKATKSASLFHATGGLCSEGRSDADVVRRPLCNSSPRDQGANGDRGMLIFPVQLTTSSIGNLTGLILALAICDDHTYILYCISKNYARFGGTRRFGRLDPHLRGRG